MAAERDLAVRVEGLGALRRALRSANRDLDAGVSVGLRTAAKVVRARARDNAPVGPAERDKHSGQLRHSLRYSVTKRKASVYSDVVYAPVHEFGGTIHPKGAPIHIPRRRMVGRAVRQSRREIDAISTGLLDHVADEYEARRHTD